MGRQETFQPKRGRPSKLTAVVSARVMEAIRAGNYLETAAAFAGIDSDTVRNWMKQGEREAVRRLQGEPPDVTLDAHVAFANELQKANSHAEVRAVAGMVKAGEKDWRAYLAFLERRFPERWGEKQHIKQEIEHTGSPLDLTKLNVAELKQLRALRKKAGAK